MTTDRPLVILRPQPVQSARIFSPQAWAALHQRYRVVDLGDDASP
jgi:hypothetical protein